MPTVTAHASGTFCWPELYTNDPIGMKRFYSALFGWKDREIPMGSDAAYVVFTLNGSEVAACYGKTPDAYARILPLSYWMSYVSVAGTDAVAATAKAAGGTIVKEPFDVPHTGRMAVLRDPTGAVFSLWEDRGKPGIGVVREPGALYWTELLTPDTEGAARFYEIVFGWKRRLWPSDDEPAYHLFANGEAVAGGMTPITAEMDVPPVWVVYFHVTDCDRSIEEARRLGGRLTLAPQTVPTVGTFAFVRDPSGAHFGILQPA